MKRQAVALSSCEADYQSLAAAVLEATFLRSPLCEMGYKQSWATIIEEDNWNCIKLTTNRVIQMRSKYFDTKVHFIADKVEDRTVDLVYTPTY